MKRIESFIIGITKRFPCCGKLHIFKVRADLIGSEDKCIDCMVYYRISLQQKEEEGIYYLNVKKLETI